MRKNYPITELCEALGVSPSGYHAAKKRPKTTRPDHAAHPSPNLLAKADPPVSPGTHLVGDITYIPTREGWLDLAVVIDLFSRAILGWKIADSLHSEIVTGALQRAIRTGHIAAGAIFHSDRGCQYTASQTRDLLRTHGVLQSMSAAGYCYDNTFAESAFASLKAELPDAEAPFPSLPNRLLVSRFSITARPSITAAVATLPSVLSRPSMTSKSTSQPTTKT